MTTPENQQPAQQQPTDGEELHKEYRSTGMEGKSNDRNKSRKTEAHVQGMKLLRKYIFEAAIGDTSQPTVYNFELADDALITVSS
ncbi:hypothetical protein LSTR_LSTR003969 [Laodelphax striatellus]|uniref:Uncharacterized protein n=1 Tax=Laodelphax striatellus TaxID=195883 RepID=A0A482WFX2_LAOST|nr:hypothetical protein LSTR_LSTR003969 [Laodelphax striatellus]